MGKLVLLKGTLSAKQTRLNETVKTVEVTNIKTNEVTNYSSISSAGEALGIPQSSISVYLSRKRTTPFRGLYLFKLV